MTGRKRPSRTVEKAVYEKYNHKCAICDKKTDFDEGEVDHIRPIARGGSDALNNLQWLCYRCNKLKGSKRTSGEVKKIVKVKKSTGKKKERKDWSRVKISKANEKIPKPTQNIEVICKCEEFYSGIEILLKKFGNYRPDLIISFNRTGCILGGMIAVNKSVGCDELLNIPREKNGKKEYPYSIGSIFDQLNKEKIENKEHVLITCMSIISFRTIDYGLKYLEKKHGIKIDHAKIKIACLWITEEALHFNEKRGNYYEIYFAYKDNDAQQKLKDLCWILESKYDYK